MELAHTHLLPHLAGSRWGCSISPIDHIALPRISSTRTFHSDVFLFYSRLVGSGHGSYARLLPCPFCWLAAAALYHRARPYPRCHSPCHLLPWRACAPTPAFSVPALLARRP